MSVTNSWKTLTGQFHWTKMDLLLFNRLTLGKTQPSAVDELFRGRDGSEG